MQVDDPASTEDSVESLDATELAARLAAGDPALADKVVRELRQARVMNRIADAVGQSGGLDVILPPVVALIAEALEADRATLFLHDGETAELFSRVATGGGVAEIRIPEDVGVAGAVFGTGVAEAIEDAYADPRFNGAVDRRTGYRTGTILAAPISTVDGRIVGVVQALNKADDRQFDEDDIALTVAMARQAAAALERAWLNEQLQRAKRDESRLLEISEWISAELDLDRLLDRIGEATTDLLDCERATIFLHDPATGELVSRQASGGEVNEIRIPADAGIAGHVFVSCAIDNVPDAYADDRFNQDVDKATGFRTRSILASPIRDRAGLPIGVIQALNRRGGPFGVMEEKRVSAFSAQLAVALQNAQLFADVMELKNYNEGILKSLSNGVVTLNADGQIEKANEAAERILGLNMSAGANAPRDADLVFGANEWVLRSIDYVARTGGDEFHADTDYVLPTGEKVAVNLTVSPLIGIDDEPMGCVLAFEDITQEKRVRGAMTRYMAKEVVDRLLEEQSFSLGGESVVATVLFSDIRRFTTLAEGMQAGGVVELLNEYFTDMVEVIFSRNGVLDKYIGDAIMAVFGAPVRSGRHADDAVLTGVEMQRALRELNKRRTDRGQDPIEIGIGLCTGEVLSGSIGSEKRLEYTVIGDSVNLASRLEGANKHFGTSVLLAETTAELLKDEHTLRPIDYIRVKGRQKPVEVFEALDYAIDVEGDGLKRMLDVYGTAKRAYRDRRWQDAIGGFAAALEMRPHDGPAKVYLNRCRYYTDQPPEDDWDGVWQITEK